MSAHRIDTPIPINRYDVVGIDSERGESFIQHVGLSSGDITDVDINCPIIIAHMGPPLQGHRRKTVHVHGECELTHDEIQQITAFEKQLELEYEFAKIDRSPAEQYIAHPHVLLTELGYSRFSCAGFVLEAYEWAGITLLVTESDSIPDLELDTIKQAYPLIEKYDREEYGLTGDGPWPVVLPGYIFNALNRPTSEIRSSPYTPQSGDEYFPPNRS